MFSWKKSNLRYVFPLLVFVAAVCVLLRIGPAFPASGESGRRQNITIVLDAGHGGVDGGTVGRSGTVEKDINLAITLRVNAFLQFLGAETALTRQDDRSLHGEEAVTLRQQKRADLAYRLGFTLSFKQPVYIGIHQNFFNNHTSRGTQTFYSQNHPGSAVAAKILQDSVRNALQNDNQRAIAKAPVNVFLLKQLTCPAVIVECGFLSNPEEEMLLYSQDYQNKLAFALAGGILGLTEQVFVE